MKDLIKEYGLRFTIGILVFIILFLVRIYLVPVMSWRIFWFALSLPFLFGYCYLIWYSTDTPGLYKEPKIIIFEPRLYDYKNHECENDFSEDIKQYLLYKEKLENIKDGFGRHSNRDALIFAVLPLFIGMPMATLSIESLLHIKVPTFLAITVSLLVVTVCIGLSLYITRKIYYPHYALKSFEYSEADIKKLLSELDEMQYNRQKIYGHNRYLHSIEKPLKHRHNAFIFCAVAPVVIAAFTILIL